MKTCAIFGPKQGGLVDKPQPKAAKNSAVVKVYAAPMCTEYKAYTAGKPADTLGHEAAGEVVEVAQSGPVKVGDRVVVMPQFPCGVCPHCVAGDYIFCQHTVDILAETGNAAGKATYAQYLIKQDWLLMPIPDDLSYDHASLACCGLGPTFGAMDQMNVGAFDTVAICGMGPVGLGGVINAAYRGARIIAVEGQKYRADLAKQLGAHAVLDPADPGTPAKILELTGGRGFDAGIDCSGVPAAQRLLIDGARRRGQVAFVGEGGALEIKVSDDMIRKGLRLQGCWHYNRSLYPQIIQVIRDSKEKIGRFITHTFPMEKVSTAWDLQLTGQCGKVILHPWE
jgi:L-iditol 2-dehydrogenase